MKLMRFFLCLACVLTVELTFAAWPYSNDLTTSISDWTVTGGGLAVSDGCLKPTGGLPTLGYVTDTTGWSADMTVCVKANRNPASTSDGVNPMVLARVTNGSQFYFYRVTTNYTSKSASAELYSFGPAGNNQLAWAGVSGFDLTKNSLYYRFNTMTVGSSVYLVGEASYDADFSTILNRLRKVETANIQNGTSAGVRAYTGAENATYNDFSAAALNVWTNASGGAWEAASNWSGGAVPNGAGALADFSMVNPTAAPTVTVTGAKTVGRLIFGDMDGNSAWTLSGDGLTLSSGAAGVKSVVTVDSGSSVAINNKLSSTDDIALNGGGTLALTKASGNSLTGDWYVSGGSVLSTNNHQTYTAQKTSDEALGSGKIFLNGGTLYGRKDGTNYNIRVNNDLVVTGSSTLKSETNTELYLLGSISGSGDLTESVTYSLKLYGDNSAYTGNWTMTGDFIWGGLKTNATPQAGWKGTGDYSFGSGTITMKNCGLGVLTNGGFVMNDIIVPSGNSTSLLKGASATYTTNLAGKITGAGTININNNSVGTTNLLGDNSAFTGTWNLLAYKIVTNNTNAAKVNGGDSRFGSGQINIGFTKTTANGVTTVYQGTLAAAADQNVYVHNNINITHDKTDADYADKKLQPFTTPSGSTLTLTGTLTGNADVHKTDAGTLVLAGNGTAYTGDWFITGGKIATSNTSSSASSGADQRFGTGTIHIGNATLSCTAVSAKYVHSNMEITGPVTIDLTNGYELFLTGNLTGSGTITRAGGDLTFGLSGDNSAFTGNWIIKQDVVKTNNSNPGAWTGADRSFGSGILYLNGGGLRTDDTSFIDCDVVFQKGQQMRGNGYTLRGVFALEGGVTANTASTNPQPTLTFTNHLIGKGTVNAKSVFQNGSVIAPGDALTVNSTTGDRSITKGVGTLTFNRDVTLNDGTTLEIDMASLTSYDKIVMNVTEAGYSNALDLGGTTLNLNFLDGFNAAGLKMFDAFDVFTGADLTASSLPTLNYDANALANAYDGARLMLAFSDGKLQIQAVNASYVPEPSTWLLLTSALFLLSFHSFLRRRREN